ncbi:MAG: O-antigen ligase family protein [bacterium]
MALFIFAGIFILTSFTGIDFNLSFWSDIERMEGAFSFLHLAVYFIIIMSIFKNKEEWKKLLYGFWGVCILLCLYGVGQKLGFNRFLLAGDARVSSTLGNSAYFAGILLFAVALSLLFFFETNNKFYKFIYLAVLLFNLWMLLFTGTRGAYVGLAASIVFCLAIYAILCKNKKIKMIALACFCFFIFCGVLLVINSEKEFIKSNHYLYRLSHFSFKDATLNTRLISWKAGWKGFLEKPVFGVGSGNYAYFFDKYFPPNFYSYTSSQTYFDHAHNTLVDVITTMGLLGILSYLAIWAIIISYLISNFKNGLINLTEFIILSGVLIAYFIQNIFVFDSLATFISFFIFMGYIAYPQFNKIDDRGKRKDAKAEIKRKCSPILATVIISFTAFMIIKYNIMPAKAMTVAVNGQYEIAREKDLTSGLKLYQKSLSYKTVLDRDIRSSFINIVISNGFSFYKSMEKEKFQEILDFAISEGEKNLAFNQEDTMMNLQMGQLYNFKAQSADYSQFDISRGEFYLNRALKSSPGRLQIYFILAQNRLLAKDNEKAISLLEDAKKMNPNYNECYDNLIRAYFYIGNYDKAYNNLWEVVSKGFDGYNEKELTEAIKYFTENKNYDKLVVLYERLLEKDPKNASLIARLAVVYANLGQNEEAKEMAIKAVGLDASLKDEAEKFLEMIAK